MTINSETRTAGPYTGSGTTGPFTFAFEIFLTSDLLVQTKKISDGTIATLALTTDYTVSLNADQNNNPGGTITLVASLSSSYTLTMTSAVPNLQKTTITNNGGFFPKVINTALDRLTILVQQNKVTASRAIKFPVVDGTNLTTELPAAAQRALKAVVFDGSGNVAVSADNYNDQVATVAASAAAAAASAGTANADVVLTHADVVLTHADVVLTHADVVTTGNNVTTATTQAGIATTQAGTATTQAGIATTQAGTATTQAGLAATAKTNCDSDKSACDADVVLTHADVVLTHADVVLTHADVVLTHADVVTTGNNVTTATTQAGTATTQATNASASATAAAASAAAASASAAGISMKSSCRVASTAALTVTYANGTSGVGATLTNAGAQAAIAIDGVTLAVNDRVLVKDQASGLQNGIYSATTLGDGTHNWVLTRVTDYDQAAEIIEGTATIIEEGTVNASHIYVMTHNGAITVGTTSIDWTSLTANATSANTLTTPRAIYGNNFDGSAALSQIIASTYGGTGNGFTKFSGATTAEKTFTLPNASATILTDNAAVSVAQGGTGLASYAAGDILYCSATNVLSKLAKGADTNVLTLASGLPSWVAPASGAQSATTFQRLTSGSGATYTKPAGCTAILVRALGGGGGGGQGTAAGSTGNAGGTTTFNSINAAGGSGGDFARVDGGAGGAGGTGGTGAATFRMDGNVGGGGSCGVTSRTPSGGNGGVAFLGGGGAALFSGGGTATDARANSGSGGGGGGGSATGVAGAGGGGAGEYFELYIASPSSTYTYTIGAGGAATTNTPKGSAGGSGIIIVEEFYG